MSAAFDFNDRVSLTGTLTKVDWRNPHIYLSLDVKREGDQVEAWSIERPSPSFFRARTQQRRLQGGGRQTRRRGQSCKDHSSPSDHHAPDSEVISLITELLEGRRGAKNPVAHPPWKGSHVTKSPRTSAMVTAAALALAGFWRRARGQASFPDRRTSARYQIPQRTLASSPCSTAPANPSAR
jgi:hypothetical protein